MSKKEAKTLPENVHRNCLTSNKELFDMDKKQSTHEMFHE